MTDLRQTDLRHHDTAPINVELTGASFGGRMVGRRDGRVTFVAGGLPGETLQAQVTKAHKNFAEARATDLVSADTQGARVEPRCPFFGEDMRQRGSLAQQRSRQTGARTVACGGCQYQHASYDTQVAMKTQILADLLCRVGKLVDVQIDDPIVGPSPWNYRNKARWTIDSSGKPAYFAAESHDMVTIDQCHIIALPLVHVLDRLRQPATCRVLADNVLELTARCAPPWIDAPEQANTTSEQTRDRVILVAHPRTGFDWEALENLAQELIEQEDNLLDGFLVAPVGGTARESELVWGSGTFDTRFAGMQFNLNPLAFFQINTLVAEEMVRTALALLAPLRGQTVLDVYSGAGTFSLPLARYAAEVFSIESDKGTIGSAHASAALNKINTLHLMAGDAGAEMGNLTADMIDAAVVDPPRSGLTPHVIAELVRLGPQKIVYVSCDPATLARDLHSFSTQGYRIANTRLVDLFPQTASVESLTLLERI